MHLYTKFRAYIIWNIFEIANLKFMEFHLYFSPNFEYLPFPCDLINFDSFMRMVAWIQSFNFKRVQSQPLFDDEIHTLTGTEGCSLHCCQYFVLLQSSTVSEKVKLNHEQLACVVDMFHVFILCIVFGWKIVFEFRLLAKVDHITQNLKVSCLIL